jgi:hypothetical protein
VICTDKRPDTQRMMVASVTASAHRFSIDGTGYGQTGTVHTCAGHPVRGREHPILRELARSTCLSRATSLLERDGVLDR